MNCAQCSQAYPSGHQAEAAIAIFVLGDEYIYSYWRCPACEHYTVAWYHDSFLGDDDAGELAPVPREVGDRCVALVRACPDPMDKNCDCASHEALYHGLPRD